MKARRKFSPAPHTAILVLLSLASGCVHRADDDLSPRPQAKPAPWQNGIPQSMQQGR